jgi:type I restriction enzyme S subunit
MKETWLRTDFENCLEKVKYKNKIHSKDFKPNGLFPIVSQEKDYISGYWDNSEDLFKVDAPVIIFGDHTRVIKYIDFSFVLGADGVKILKPKPSIHPKFLYYFLLNVDLGNLGYARHYRLLKEIEISYPNTLNKQQLIVNILDECFKAIDQAKANTERNLKNARELFDSYLQGVFERRGDDWHEKKLGEIFDVRDGTHESPKYINKGFPLVTSKNLKDHRLVLDPIKYISESDYININKRSKVDVGDVLFAMIGTIGNPVVVEDEPNYAIKNVALFKGNDNQSSNFLKYLLDSKLTKDKMIEDAKGTTQKFVGLGYLRSFPIFIPSLTKQQAIVSQLDALRTETKKLESSFLEKMTDLDELKKSILQKAFAGEISTDREMTV